MNIFGMKKGKKQGEKLDKSTNLETRSALERERERAVI